MRMFIPEIGTRIRLAADWSFPLIEEDRNSSLFNPLAALAPERIADMREEASQIRKQAREDPEGMSWKEQYDRRVDLFRRADNHVRIDITLPAGTEITIDRIYIRKGVSDFSSVSFNLNQTTHPDLQFRGRKRFWAKLQDVNRIEFQLIEA